MSSRRSPRRPRPHGDTAPAAHRGGSGTGVVPEHKSSIPATTPRRLASHHLSPMDTTDAVDDVNKRARAAWNERYGHLTTK